jgi:transcriptional regulator of arginine metabolism
VTSVPVTSGSNTLALDKPLLAYLYINAVFLYRVRSGWPLGGSAAFFRSETRVSKEQRHNAIRQLVAAESIASQDELRRRLVRRGCAVTQATLSRDIHELRLYKGPNGYEAPNGNGHIEEEEEQPAVGEVLSSFGVAVRQAQNQLVLRTTSGGAQPVALAIDHEEWHDVVGTLAGDDTVLIICLDPRRASHMREKLERMIG